VTVATTIKFNLDNEGWYYLVCNNCNKRTYEAVSFKCTYCDKDNALLVFKLVYCYIVFYIMWSILVVNCNFCLLSRYRLQVQVCDDSNNYAIFVVWDQECSNIIGLSTADLQKRMIEVNFFIFCIVYFVYAISGVKKNGFYIILLSITAMKWNLFYIILLLITIGWWRWPPLLSWCIGYNARLYLCI